MRKVKQQYLLFQVLERCFLTIILWLYILNVECAVQDLTSAESKPALYRNTRDNRYYLNRYGSSSLLSSNRSIKTDDLPEARASDAGSNLDKRCIRCSGYYDPYDYRVQSRAYEDRDRYYDRYYDKSYDDRRYDDRYDYNRDRYDYRYDNRYDNRYDRPYDRDKWYDRRYDDRYDYRGYDYRDRYDRYDNRGFGYDNRGYDNRGYDYRGTGYDNRGYDYKRGHYDNRVNRPWDDASRGWDTSGRGYYSSGRPDWGSGYDKSYAAGWNYGRGDGYRDQW